MKEKLSYNSEPLLEVVRMVSSGDFAGVCRTILPDVYYKLKNSEKHEEILGALLVLKNLNYAYEKRLFAKEVDVLVRNTMGELRNLAERLLSNYTMQAGECLHVILDIFGFSIYV